MNDIISLYYLKMKQSAKDYRMDHSRSNYDSFMNARDNYYSGILIKYCEDTDYIKVYTYIS